MNFKSIILLILVFSAATVHAQWDDEDSYVSRRQGIEFGVNFGVYNANDKSAIFYDGYGEYDLGDNSATLYSIQERIELGTTRAVIQDLLNLDQGFSIPYGYADFMVYDPAMMFGIKTVYFWNPENALILNMDAVSLRARGPWYIKDDGFNGIGLDSNNYIECGAFGEERRMMTSLGYRTSAYILDDAAWIFEFGGTMTATQVERNYVAIANQTFDLITMYTGPGQYTNATSRLTSVGFGFYTVIGLEALFDEGGNLEANLRLSRDKIHLGSKVETDVSYDANLWNAALYVTWMIPPHIGNFVKAAF